MIDLPIIVTRFSIEMGIHNPDLCTDYIGLNPTRVLKKGAGRQQPRPPVSASSWEIDTEKRTIYSIDDSITELMDVIWPKKDRIVEFCKQYVVQCLFISVVWADDEHRPVYELSRQSLERIGKFNAAWIMDLV